ncbi:hypothetical protein HG535_0G00290 [Zygotorulaspora mrakii]|uniref:Suppressor of forked domain-containing protein n=1 Tax=Zygotorulaspora mrakii TaxID=42260 RepID=A0A7H9B745_ZYGMR|nr:uncharacterized protein HG535_0G00290 [Zygotorulaspora mrakii]QLG74144.1 hypothetical protein HG535_0G00290 [Zygotorulaspora mrakii]
MPGLNTNNIAEGSDKALYGLDPSFLKENPQLVNSYENIHWDSINSLNALVGAIEQVVIKYKNPNDRIKLAIEKMYRELLQKYPLFFGYWKRFTAVEYQLFGLQKSIDTLKKSVEAFPSSLELWCDYLNVLCTNNAVETTLIRGNFQVAKELIGYQFLSHPFWDKYIEFETKNEQSSNLKSIYEELVRIPLHQYAKYGVAYREFLRGIASQSEILDLDATIRSTQKAVTAIWPYESKIKQNFFTLSPVSNGELTNWDSYLEFIQLNRQQYNFSGEMIRAVFERCLVPCLYYEAFWIRFVKWFQREDSSVIQHVIEIFQKGISVLPITSRTFRLQFLQYLKKNLRNDKSYMFSIYSQTIASYMKIWPDQSSLMAEYLSLMKRTEFGSTIEQQDKEVLSKQTAYSNFLELAVRNYLQRRVDRSIPLQDVINDSNIAVVIVELIKSAWLVLKNIMQTRKYFNFYGKSPLLRTSVSFWLTYYKFEKSQQNFTKLNKFINDLGTNIFLPTTIVNDILIDYQSFYLANSNIADYQEHFAIVENSQEIQIADPILFSQFKINDPAWVPNLYKNSLDWYKSREFKENGHPGIIDEKPLITNAILEESSKSFDNVLPPLPTFRNLEKINQAVKYDDKFEKEHIGSNT